MNKSKIIFVGTFVIMVVFILTLSLFYSRAVKKKMHFLYQLGQEISRPEDTEPEKSSIELVFSNNGTKIITLLNNGNIDIWDLNNQKIAVSFKTDSIFSYCAQNDYIFIEKDGDIYLVDINNGDRFKLTSGKYRYSSIDKECNRLALSGSDHVIEIWSLTEPKILNKFKSELPVRNGLSLSPDGSIVAAAEGIYHENENRHETKIETWRLESNDGRNTVKLNSVSSDHIAGVWNIFFSPDSARLIYDTQKSAESGISITDLQGNVIFEKNDLDSFWTRALAISPDGDTLASGDEKGNLVLWDVNTKEIKSYYRLGEVIESLGFSDNGAMLAAGLANSTIQVFQILHAKN